MKSIDSLPEELKDVVSQWAERLESSHPGGVDNVAATPRCVTELTKLVAVSEFAANVITREWPWVESCCENDTFRQPPDIDTLQAFAAEIAASTDDVGSTKRRLRQFRNRWLLQVLWRDLSGVGLPVNLIWTPEERRIDAGPRPPARWKETLVSLGCSP